MKCQCPSETHGHEAGKCTNLATEADRMCKPCHDSWADEAMPTAKSLLSEPTRVGRPHASPWHV
jgi:hypothetical protein